MPQTHPHFVTKPTRSDADAVIIAGDFVREMLSSIDDYVDEFFWYQLLSGDPVSPRIASAYRREVKRFAMSELAAGRYGVVPEDDASAPRPPF